MSDKNKVRPKLEAIVSFQSTLTSSHCQIVLESNNCNRGTSWNKRLPEQSPTRTSDSCYSKLTQDMSFRNVDNTTEEKKIYQHDQTDVNNRSPSVQIDTSAQLINFQNQVTTTLTNSSSSDFLKNESELLNATSSVLYTQSNQSQMETAGNQKKKTRTELDNERVTYNAKQYSAGSGCWKFQKKNSTNRSKEHNEQNDTVSTERSNVLPNEEALTEINSKFRGHSNEHERLQECTEQIGPDNGFNKQFKKEKYNFNEMVKIIKNMEHETVSQKSKDNPIVFDNNRTDDTLATCQHNNIKKTTFTASFLRRSNCSSNVSKSQHRDTNADGSSCVEYGVKYTWSEQSLSQSNTTEAVKCSSLPSPVKPPRVIKSPKSGKLRNLLSSPSSLTNKGHSGNQCRFDGQYHREDDITHEVSDEISKQTDNTRNLTLRRETNQRDESDQHIAEKMPTNHAQPQHFAVIAVDLGTTHSGYSCVRDACHMYTMRRCAENEHRLVCQKTLTSILLTPDGQFHSFGYNARKHYLSLCPQEAQHWLYFSNFKKDLYQHDKLNMDTVLVASNGGKFSAFEILTLSLKFFKREALEQLTSDAENDCAKQVIRWVITVPAGWTSSDKQFIRQAAYEAGIASSTRQEQLYIVEETEATSVYCRTLQICDRIPQNTVECFVQGSERQGSSHWFSEDSTATYFTLGARYLVIDCGGDIVNITVNELDSCGHITELHSETGRQYGNLGIDVRFESLLSAIFGIDFLEHYKRKYPVGWVHLMTDFESHKRSVSLFKSGSVTLSPSFTFINEFLKRRCDPETAVKCYRDLEISWSSQGMLTLTLKAVRNLYLPMINFIKQAVGDVLNHSNVKDVKLIFLVGGLAESPIIQQEITQEFCNMIKVITPSDASLAILKGALYFGIDPMIVERRRTYLTYGVGILDRFDLRHHPTSKKVKTNRCEWCIDIFDKYIGPDEDIVLGKTIVKSYTLSKPDQTSIVLNMYCSTNPKVQFITDPSVTRCCTLCLILPVIHQDVLDGTAGDIHKSTRVIETRMSFSETEIKVIVVDISTGHMVQASVDFLGRQYLLQK